MWTFPTPLRLPNFGRSFITIERLQLHTLAHNLANFLRTRALPQEVQHWSLASIRDRLLKTGAKLVRHARYDVFQMAEIAVPRDLFRRIRTNIADLRCRPPTPC
jgi:Transposase DDE domain group 1